MRPSTKPRTGNCVSPRSPLDVKSKWLSRIDCKTCHRRCQCEDLRGAAGAAAAGLAGGFIADFEPVADDEAATFATGGADGLGVIFGVLVSTGFGGSAAASASP